MNVFRIRFKWGCALASTLNIDPIHKKLMVTPAKLDCDHKYDLCSILKIWKEQINKGYQEFCPQCVHEKRYCDLTAIKEISLVETTLAVNSQEGLECVDQDPFFLRKREELMDKMRQNAGKLPREVFLPIAARWPDSPPESRAHSWDRATQNNCVTLMAALAAFYCALRVLKVALLCVFCLK